MTKINPVAKGESDWQVTLNQLINVVNELGGGTVEHLANPLTFLNGASAAQSDLYYTEQPGGYRQCYLTASKVHADNFNYADLLFRFPDGFKPLGGASFSIDEASFGFDKDDGNVWVFTKFAKDNKLTISEGYIGFSYTAKVNN